MKNVYKDSTKKIGVRRYHLYSGCNENHPLNKLNRKKSQMSLHVYFKFVRFNKIHRLSK